MMWLALGVVWLAVLVFVWALCAAAARADVLIRASFGTWSDETTKLGTSPLNGLSDLIATEDASQAEFEVVKARSLLAPRWWQIRRRLSWRRLNRAFKRKRAEIETLAPGLPGRIDAEIGHAFLFGTGTHHGESRP